MGLFKSKPLYNDFTITADASGGNLFAHFTSTARKKNGAPDTARNATLPPYILAEQVRDGKMHPDDRALFMLALERMTLLSENGRFHAAFKDAAARCKAAQTRIENLLASDRYDLPPPEKPYRRHLNRKDEPARFYKSFTLITGTPDNIRASLKLVKPDMHYSATSRAYHPHFTNDFTEHRLLYEYNNNGHLNYDDQLLVHEALRELRAYKIQNNLPVIPLKPVPPPQPERPRYRGHGIYF